MSYRASFGADIGAIFRVEKRLLNCHPGGRRGGERAPRRRRAGAVRRLVLQPHREVAHGPQVGHAKLPRLRLRPQGRRRRLRQRQEHPRPRHQDRVVNEWAVFYHSNMPHPSIYSFEYHQMWGQALSELQMSHSERKSRGKWLSCN